MEALFLNESEKELNDLVNQIEDIQKSKSEKECQLLYDKNGHIYDLDFGHFNIQDKNTKQILDQLQDNLEKMPNQIYINNFDQKYFNSSKKEEKIEDEEKIQKNSEEFFESKNQIRDIFQRQIIKKIKEQWEISKFGSIVFLETGSGKSYIALLIIKHIFDQNEILIKLTDEELKQKHQQKKDDLLNNRQKVYNKKVVMIVPTTNLIDQQSQLIDQYTDLSVFKLQGGQKNQKNNKYDSFRTEFLNTDVMVCIPKKFYDFLARGFLKMKEIDLLIFDEAHHTQQDHPYNLIMEDHFFLPNFDSEKHPRVLGLTASPIIGRSQNGALNQYEVQKNLQELCNNLYSCFVPIDKESLDQLKNSAEVFLILYRSHFDQIIESMRSIEQNLIIKLLKLINIPDSIYNASEKLDEQEKLQKVLRSFSDNVIEEAQICQDIQVLQFLTKRKQLIDLNSNYSKSSINISLIKKDEHKTLAILVIILLKNINNLMLELGNIGVRMFIDDIIKETIDKKFKIIENRKQVEEIFKDFRSLRLGDQISKDKEQETVLKSFEKQLSGKVIQLCDLLISQNKMIENLKAIIFVKDRTVACYLKSVLELIFSSKSQKNDIPNNENSENFNASIFRQILNKDNLHLNFGVAIGFQGASLTSKAMKSTKQQQEDDFEISNDKSFIPQLQQASMTNAQLIQTIQKFKNNEINVLIATSVIEEGLDVSTCNLVICLNEIMTIKSFIQTKGRARQRNSKYFFLCAEEQKEQFLNEINSIQESIELIQTIAYRDNKEIKPIPDIIRMKQNKPEKNYFTIPEGGRLNSRDSQSIILQFLNELEGLDKAGFIDRAKILERKTDQMKELEMKLTSKELESIKKVQSKREKYQIFKQSTETVKNGKKYYLCRLIMPKIFEGFLEFVKGDSGRPQKKDSENRTYLKLVKILHTCELIDNYLFPDFRHILNDAGKRKMFQAQQNQLQQQNQMIRPSVQEQKEIVQQIKKIKTVDEEQKASLKKDTDQFNQEKRIAKSKVATLQKKDYFNRQIGKIEEMCQIDNLQEELDRNELQKQIQNNNLLPRIPLYCLIFKEAKQGHAYPFKSTQEYLGALFDKDVNNINIQYELPQEQRQMQKNKYFVDLLVNFGLINSTGKDQVVQNQDILNFKVDCIQLQDLLWDTKCQTISDLLDILQRIKIYHMFTFYMIYNCQHKFFKRLTKRKFSFHYIFEKLIILLEKQLENQNAKIYQEYEGFVSFYQYVYDFKKSVLKQNVLPKQKKQQEFPQDSEKGDIGTFIMPIIKDKTNQQYKLNMPLIQNVIDYINTEILGFWFTNSTEKQMVFNQYGIIEYSNFDKIFKQEEQQTKINDEKMKQSSKFERILNLFAQKTEIINRTVQNIYSCESNHNLYNILSGEKVNSEIWDKKQITLIPNSVKKQYGHLSEYKLKQLGQNLSVSDHYFIKTGIYLRMRENNIFYKASKQRHYLEFQKKSLEEEKQSPAKQIPNRRDNQQQIGVIEEKSPNTVFDLPDQLMSLTPFTYEHYQILQTTLFNQSALSEKLQIYQFIESDLISNLNLKKQIEIQKIVKDKQIKNYLKDYILNLDLDCIRKIDHTKYLTAQDYLLQNPRDILEAFTAPTVDILNYERLEFYGDSVISFLVILELFLCGDQNWAEGILDFERIKAISNMHFKKINEKFALHQYMVTENKQIYSDNIPSGFDPKDFQNKIKHKFMNEVETKLIHLRKLSFDLKKKIQTRQDNFDSNIFDQEYSDLIKLFCTCEDFKELLWDEQQYLENVVREEKQRFHSKDLRIQNATLDQPLIAPSWQMGILERIAKRWQTEFNIWKDDLILKVVEMNIRKCLIKYTKEKEIKSKGRPGPIGQENLKNKQGNFDKDNVKQIKCSYKQLADIVESVTGAVNVNFGLIISQQYISQLGILNHSIEEYNFQLKQFYMQECSIEDALKEWNLQSGFKLNELEKTIGYQFKNKKLLLQALTHSSYKEYHSLMFKNIENYERLEFLGDSILNFLVAQKFFLQSQDCPNLFRPKELHRQKTSVVNNVVLSLAVIENNINEYILINLQSHEFFSQFKNYVNEVHDALKVQISTKELAKKKAQIKMKQIILFKLKQYIEECMKQPINLTIANTSQQQNYQYQDVYSQKVNSGITELLYESTDSHSPMFSSSFAQSNLKYQYCLQSINNQISNLKQESLSLTYDLDHLYESTLKIFGDVFESIIGAIFLDCQDLQRTSEVLFNLLDSYVTVFAYDLDSIQEHKRTTLLELWNSFDYTKCFKLYHRTETVGPDVIFKGYINNKEVKTVKFVQQDKNKVRKFYKKFYAFIKEYLEVFLPSKFANPDEISPRDVENYIYDFQLIYQAKKAQRKKQKIMEKQQKEQNMQVELMNKEDQKLRTNLFGPFNPQQTLNQTISTKLQNSTMNINAPIFKKPEKKSQI